MKKFIRFFIYFLLIIVCPMIVVLPVSGGAIYQNFEKSETCFKTWDPYVTLTRVKNPEPIHGGTYSLKISSPKTWSYAHISSIKSEDRDFTAWRTDRLTFWYYAVPNNRMQMELIVKFHDIYGKTFEVRPTFYTQYHKWSKLHVLWEQIDQRKIDLQHIKNIEFINKEPGTFYLDDICIVKEDRNYQTFEVETLSDTNQNDQGWVWGDSNNYVEMSKEQVYEGDYSWKMVLYDYCGGTGIKGEQKYQNGDNPYSFYWHNNLDPDIHDYLTFWVYALPSNELDNNVNVQFFDQGYYKNYKIEYWTNKPTRTGEWTQIWVPLKDLLRLRDSNDPNKDTAPPINLKDIDKIQIQMYWPGTYYIDNIIAVNSVPLWDRGSLKEGMLKWHTQHALDQFHLQMENPPHSDIWETIYIGKNTSYDFSKSFNERYRVRSEEIKTSTNEAPFISAWCEILEYYPPDEGKDTLSFLHTNGKLIVDETGSAVDLRGINLGGFLLIEPWMNEWGDYNADDYTIRKKLKERFSDNQVIELLKYYRKSFITEADFDIIKRIGLNFVRLPIYYVDLQDPNGNLQPKAFEEIDWLVASCAKRGIYVLLDLHGAPGAQNREANSGRKDWNKLFEKSAEGESYRNKTESLWEKIASHYNDNPAIMGYDLLNEPTGVIKDPNVGLTESDKAVLWNFYDRLYNAIRKIDQKHIITMQGIWDWDTLPDPYKKGWENIVYQFQYYHWVKLDEDFKKDLDMYIQSHKDFINLKIIMSQQVKYQVPVLIGEFNCFDVLDVWEYYLQNFKEQQWGWAIWSYKVTSPNSRWGLVTDYDFDKNFLPDFEKDSYEKLKTKMSKVDTLSHYALSNSLFKILKKYIPRPLISATPIHYSFGEVTLGDPQTQTFTITNTGTKELIISEVTLEDNKNFYLDENAGSSPCSTIASTIQIDNSCSIMVTFTPKSQGTFTTNLIIVSDDPDTQQLRIPLNGIGKKIDNGSGGICFIGYVE